MTRDEIEAVVRDEIAAIAPEAALGALGPEDDIRDALDLDSMDMLTLVTALHERLGVDIPEQDTGAFVTLAGAVGFLQARLP